MASELLERVLYNGKYNMVHNPDAKGSSPRYKLVDDIKAEKPTILSKPKGVTTILGSVLAKDFVGWALDSMAAVLLEFLPKKITAADIELAKGASAAKRDSGANTGSEAHALVEHYLKAKAANNVDFLPQEDGSQEAENAYQAFVKWFEEVKPEVINVEEVIYSEEFGYAGTYDCMLRIDGKVYLCDLKTTNTSRKAPKGVYAEYFVQLGAYALAHDEQQVYEEANGGTTLEPIAGLMVISAKKDGKLDIVTNEDIGLSLEDCKTMFKKVVNLFEFLKYTTDKLGGK